jgi:hypothetical protein
MSSSRLLDRHNETAERALRAHVRAKRGRKNLRGLAAARALLVGESVMPRSAWVVVVVERSRGARMNEIVFVVEEAPEGGYTARALGESIFTEADSLPELRVAVQDAVRCHFDGATDVPTVIRLHFVREELIRA